jgi:transaldolase/glucose-6-phosphate isomerase
MDTVVQTADQNTINPLKKLLAAGQSPWLDFIRRSFIEDGSLKKLVDQDGLGGVTSNPSIFEKAMGSGADYDEQFKQLAATGEHDASALYETMAVTDIQHATEVLRTVFDRTGGLDGFVSLEVSPYLALREQDTVTEARRLWKWVDRPNLMVKVPGTPECVPAIRTLIADGININVTLLFSQGSYRQVAEAYVAGLEERHAKGQDISHISSVASFFVSRIDAVIDKKIDQRLAEGDTEAEALKAIRGKVAIANAKLAYAWYEDFVASERWQKLKAAGANPQRLLWASTGTKDPHAPDTLYIDGLAAPDTVNTMPEPTLLAFAAHGKAPAALPTDGGDCETVLAGFARGGIDTGVLAEQLQQQGAAGFVKSWKDLMSCIQSKANPVPAAA